jgi:hypothetical protein
MVQGTLVNWAAGCEFENKQSLACARSSTHMPSRHQCHSCQMKAWTNHLGIMLMGQNTIMSWLPWACFSVKCPDRRRLAVRKHAIILVIAREHGIPIKWFLSWLRILSASQISWGMVVSVAGLRALNTWAKVLGERDILKIKGLHSSWGFQGLLHTSAQTKQEHMHARIKGAVHCMFTAWHGICSGMLKMRGRNANSHMPLQRGSACSRSHPTATLLPLDIIQTMGRL